MTKMIFAVVSLFFLWACAPTAVVDTSRPTVSSVPSLQDRSPLYRTETMPSALLGRSVTYHVYLPSSYGVDQARDYPVVYWLHGSGGYPRGALTMLSGRFDRAMTEGKMPEAIIVFPDGFEDTLWLDSKDGTNPVERFLVDEFVPYIDAAFQTRPEPEGRILEGGSMGGYGAARLGLRYPDLFGAISMINPGPMQRVMNVDQTPIAGKEKAQAIMRDVFANDAAHFTAQSPWELAGSFAPTGRDLRVRLILGETDPTMPVNKLFSERLSALGIDHDLVVIPNAGHDPRAMFAGMGDDYWRFFNRALSTR